MIARCNLTDGDYRAFRRHILFRCYKVHWLYGGLLVLLLALTWFGSNPEETVTDKVYLTIGMIFILGVLGLVLFFILQTIRRFTGTRFRGPVGEHVFEVSDDGLTESNANGRVETRLSAIRRVDETPKHFFVITDAGIGHIIPKRDLESTDVLRALQSRIRKSAG
jgi:hypothetical protein